MAKLVVESSNLHFPVLTFSQGIMYHKRNNSEITHATWVGYKNGWFSKMEIVDSSGCRYRTSSVDLVESATWVTKLFNRRVQVILHLKVIENPISIQDFRSKVMKRVFEYESTGEVENIEAEIARSKSHIEVISAIPPASGPIS